MEAFLGKKLEQSQEVLQELQSTSLHKVLEGQGNRDSKFASKRALLTLQTQQMFKVANYLSAQSDYVEFWKKLAETAPASEAFRICKKYRLEVDNYRQLYTLLTAQTTSDSTGNMAKVQCIKALDANLKAASPYANGENLGELQRRTVEAQHSKAARIGDALQYHTIMAERRACYLLARGSVGLNSVSKCKMRDPTTNPGKTQIPGLGEGQNSAAFKKLAEIHEDFENVFYGERGLFSSLMYGAEASLLTFECHSVVHKTSSYCCPSRCTNCDTIAMNDGVMDGSFNDELKKALDSCEAGVPDVTE